jgi:hypothetical protein
MGGGRGPDSPAPRAFPGSPGPAPPPRRIGARAELVEEDEGALVGSLSRISRIWRTNRGERRQVLRHALVVTHEGVDRGEDGQTGSFAAGTCPPDLGHERQEREGLETIVLPPALGPVMTRSGRSGLMSMSTGTTARDGSRQLWASRSDGPATRTAHRSAPPCITGCGCVHALREFGAREDPVELRDASPRGR